MAGRFERRINHENRIWSVPDEASADDLADIAKEKDEFDGVVRLFKKLWKKYAANDSGLCIGRTTY